MKLFGVKVSRVSLAEAVELVAGELVSNQARPYFIVTPNPEQIVQAQDDGEFKQALNSADLAVPDGVGIVIAGRLLSSKFKVQSSKFKVQSSKFKVTKRESVRGGAF